MNHLNRLFCCVVVIASTLTAGQANAWHGHGHFSCHGYGFGTNHQSFQSSCYHPAWGYSSYSRASYYGGFGCWPRTTYYSSYRSYSPLSFGFAYRAPVYYSTSYWPSVYYSNYCAPTSFAPIFYGPGVYNSWYTPCITPVIYSTNYSGFPTCSVASPTLSNLSLAAHTTRKPVVNAVPFRVTNKTAPPVPASVVPGRFVLASSPVPQSDTSVSASAPSSVLDSGSVLDSAPQPLIDAADAILAAGGYKQAAQAYAQLVVKFGNSDRLATRRFVAQVANGDFDQAAVIVDLAFANGNRFDRRDLPQGDLKTALGDSSGLVALRLEGLAASALSKSDDAVPLLAVANWLSLGGDDAKAELFKARAEQLKQTDVGLLIQSR